MELLIYIMRKVEYLDELLDRFSNEEDFRATIVDSQGMARLLADRDNDALLNLRYLLNDSKVNNKMIFMALEHNRVSKAVEIIESIVGDLDRPDNGIIFTLPISFIKGNKVKEEI